MKFHHTVFAHVREGWSRHKNTILISTGVTALVIVIAVGGTMGYMKMYEGKIYPNVSIGGVDVGGLSQAETSEAVQSAYNSMLDRGLPVRLEAGEDSRIAVIDLRASGSTDPDLVYDLISVNVDKATTAAEEIGRSTDTELFNIAEALSLIFAPRSIEAEFTIAEDRLTESLLDEFGEVEVEGEPTDYTITTEKDEEYSIEVTEGSAGEKLNTSSVIISVREDVKDFELEEQQLSLVTADDVVSMEEAEELKNDIEEAIENAPYTLTYTSDLQQEFEWEIDNENIIDWIYPIRTNNGVELALDPEEMEEFLNEIREDVDVEPQNARFQVESDKVVEFKGSLDGVTLDAEAALEELAEMLGEEDVELTVAVERVKPTVTTESVNSLGIKEIVGVGTSDFSGSPSNRISNIQHGADKLNGLLIAPDEEFSLVDALSPFTVADGWLPELVIKGDEIKPEVGGGACQFGTTLFRAAMNSGLEITERRNHSLVVSYYNDPSNGNPGTDATIYDPAPDFKFKNDTENYLLLETDVDLETRIMTFTFWGTSDGRKGYYTPPEVLSWSGYGATVEKETDTLPAGVRQCQAPHSGAVTEFDYIVEYEDGETYEHTYTSTYRSLPRICLVGAGGGSNESAPENESNEQEEPETETSEEEPTLEETDTTEEDA